jgi:hypothetical protein
MKKYHVYGGRARTLFYLVNPSLKKFEEALEATEALELLKTENLQEAIKMAEEEHGVIIVREPGQVPRLYTPQIG